MQIGFIPSIINKTTGVIKNSQKMANFNVETNCDNYAPKTFEIELDGFKIKCKPQKSVTLKDSKGCDTKAILAAQTSVNGKYFIVKDEKALCRIYFNDKNDSLYIYDLQGQNNNGEFKGAGRELIKTAAQESIKRDMAEKSAYVWQIHFPFIISAILE